MKVEAMKQLLSLVLAIAAVPAMAIFPDNPEPGFGAVGRLLLNQGGQWVVNGSAVAITPTHVLTVWHVNNSTHFESVTGQIIPVTSRYLHPVADLAILKLASPVAQTAPVYFGPLSTLLGQPCKLVGYGMTGIARTLGWEIQDGTQGVRRSANNVIDWFENVTLDFGGGRFKTTDYLVCDIDNPNGLSNGSLGGPAVAGEGGIAAWDSGGPMLVFKDRMWRVAALHGFVDVLPGSGVQEPFHYGGLAYSGYLTPYKSWIQMVTFGLKGPN